MKDTKKNANIFLIKELCLSIQRDWREGDHYEYRTLDEYATARTKEFFKNNPEILA